MPQTPKPTVFTWLALLCATLAGALPRVRRRRFKVGILPLPLRNDGDSVETSLRRTWP